jgi:hypothetical protein
VITPPLRLYALDAAGHFIKSTVCHQETTMNSNYNWQQHQAKERIQARMREAEAQRMLKENSIRGDSLLMRIWKKLRVGSASGTQGHRYEPGESGFRAQIPDSKRS